MSGFSAAWLAMREPVDARARDPSLVTALPAAQTAILDLGAGTGSNLRWLAPRLGCDQRWSLIDRDETLLATARRELADWADRQGYRCSASDGRLRIRAPGFDCRVECRRLDLSQSLGRLRIPAGALVTASALLDLVSAPWLEELVDRIGSSGAMALFALNYDGLVSLEPAAAEDATMIGLVNRHQRTDKGFGAALGPAAWSFARDRLERAGHDVRTAASSWVLEAADAGLQDALIAGWGHAAAALMPTDGRRIRQWCTWRRGQAASGRLRIRVGHHDLAAWPRHPSAGVPSASSGGIAP